MEIKITDKKCGLEAGKVYDLCDQAAKGLINKRQAVLDVPAVEAPKNEKKTEPKAPKKVKTNGLQNK